MLRARCSAAIWVNGTETLTGPFQLTPFVSKTIKPLYGLYQGIPQGPKNPQVYLDRWKAENGVD